MRPHYEKRFNRPHTIKKVEEDGIDGDTDVEMEQTEDWWQIKDQRLEDIQNVDTYKWDCRKVTQVTLLDIFQAQDNIEQVTALLLESQNDSKPADPNAADPEPADANAAVEKLKLASDQLNKVHKYLMLSMEERCSSSLVVHRAQYGYASFPVDQLPDVVITKIVDYLDIEDTRNLRRVTPWLAQRILLLDQKMQKWTVKISNNEMLQAAALTLSAAETKQVKIIKNFQLTFNVHSIYDEDFDVSALIDLMETWEDYALELNIEITEILNNHFTDFYLAKLSHLSIGVMSFDNDADLTVADIIQNHAPQLKTLTMQGYPEFPQQQFDRAPQHLQIFKLGWNMSVHRPIGEEILPLMDFSRNVTKLALRNVYLPLIDANSLVFPNLKHLEIDCLKGSRLVKHNANHLETLVVYKASWNLKYSIFDGMDFAQNFPTCLTRLKTFMCWNVDVLMNIKLLYRILAPNATPMLKNLIVHSEEYIFGNRPVISLPKLTHFVFLDFPPWCQQMVAANVNTLEALVFHLDMFEDSDVKLVDLLVTMPNLKQLVILRDGYHLHTEVMARPCMKELCEKCPNVQIILECEDTMRNEWLFDWYLQSEIDKSFADSCHMDGF